MDINGYALFIIIALAIIAALLVALAAGWFLMKRRMKSRKTFWCAFAPLGVAAAYGIYWVASMTLSALDLGRLHNVGLENLAALTEGMDLGQVFAQEGAKLERTACSGSAKQCNLYFYVKDGSPVAIPSALDAYISAHPELGSGNSLRITVRIDGNADAPTCEKVYFWWRMLY